MFRRWTLSSAWVSTSMQITASSARSPAGRRRHVPARNTVWACRRKRMPSISPPQGRPPAGRVPALRFPSSIGGPARLGRARSARCPCVARRRPGEPPQIGVRLARTRRRPLGRRSVVGAKPPTPTAISLAIHAGGQAQDRVRCAHPAVPQGRSPERIARRCGLGLPARAKRAAKERPNAGSAMSPQPCQHSGAWASSPSATRARSAPWRRGTPWPVALRWPTYADLHPSITW